MMYSFPILCVPLKKINSISFLVTVEGIWDKTICWVLYQNLLVKASKVVEANEFKSQKKVNNDQILDIDQEYNVLVKILYIKNKDQVKMFHMISYNLIIIISFYLYSFLCFMISIINIF